VRIPLSVPKRYWKTNGSRGRKLGSLTKRTREIAQGALASGLTPLEYMLATMRDVTVDDARQDDMAKAAAPYIHARLSSTELKGEDNGQLVVEINEFRADRRWAARWCPQHHIFSGKDLFSAGVFVWSPSAMNETEPAALGDLETTAPRVGRAEAGRMRGRGNHSRISGMGESGPVWCARPHSTLGQSGSARSTPRP